ncbi:MAG: hypothetical protein E7C49_15165 [Clostridium sp.]|nr:hypothetical protein [Clostridium sp.]
MSEKKYNKKYHYTVYGLNIESDIEIKEFMINKNESNDIKFVLGEVPEKVNRQISNGRRAKYSKTKVWFHIENIATYYITNGDTVMVEPCENADMQLFKVYLMCSCLGFIMLQRDQVAIHGGTVVIDGKGVIFTGNRGAGKSTLTTALRHKGYPFISDDVAATYFDKVPYIYPGFPYQKLCDDVMEPMGYDKEEHTSFSGDGKVKYMVPAYDSFYDESIQLSAICQLTVGDVSEVTIEEVTGHEKLDKIIKNIYREEFIDYMGGISPIYFKKCLDIAKHIKFYKITRPKEGFTVNEQIKLIEEVFINVEEKVV